MDDMRLPQREARGTDLLNLEIAAHLPREPPEHKMLSGGFPLPSRSSGANRAVTFSRRWSTAVLLLLALRTPRPLLLRKVVDGFLECRSLADTGERRCVFQLVYGLLRQPKRYLRQCAFAVGHPAGRVSIRHVKIPGRTKSGPLNGLQWMAGQGDSEGSP
jgi:hypothetical protein